MLSNKLLEKLALSQCSKAVARHEDGTFVVVERYRHNGQDQYIFNYCPKNADYKRIEYNPQDEGIILTESGTKDSNTIWQTLESFLLPPEIRTSYYKRVE